jgi:FkbM family methyltransferase
VPGRTRDAPPLPLAARVLRRLLRSEARGSWRATDVLSRLLPSLHAVPIHFGGWPPIYVDGRQFNGREWIRLSPFADCPWEPEIQAVLRRLTRPGDAVLDVGANDGLHTVLLAQCVGPAGHVVAVEPNPMLMACLSRTVAELGNVSLHAAALGEAPGELPLYVTEDHTRSSLANWTVGIDGHGAGRTCLVPVTTVDRLLADEPALRRRTVDLVKADVEGAEALVFRGARATLDRPDAPVIVYEELLSAQEALGLPLFAASDFLLGLEHARYELHIVEEDGSLRPHHRTHPGRVNVLALPHARRDRWPGLPSAAA